LLGISSLDVLAREAQSRGIYGEITILVDAQRTEFYEARYTITESSIVGSPPRIVRTSEGAHERVIRPGEFFPSAATLLQLAATRENYLPGEKLEPIYLRETSFVKAAPARFV
jgi:tRNA A37 threonylcarbamoyladenosine modification protein TsaB